MEFNSTLNKLLGITDEEETPKKVAPTTPDAQKIEVTLDPEHTKLLNDTLQAQGGSDYVNETEGILTRGMQAAAKLRTDEDVEDPLTGLPRKVIRRKRPEELDTPPKIDPNDVPKWFDPSTGKADYETLLRVGVPQPIKRKIVTHAIKEMAGLPEKYLDDREAQIVRQTDGPTLRAGKYAAQVLDSMAGNVATGSGKHIAEFITGDAHKQDPYQVLTKDEIDSVHEAYSSRAPQKVSLRIGSYTSDPQKSVEENLREAAAQKIFAAQDTLRESTNLAIVDDLALVSQAVPALRSAAPIKALLESTGAGRAVGKALQAVDVAANPLSAAVQAGLEGRVAANAASKLAHPAVGPASRIATGAVEGALLQPIPMSEERLETKPQEMLYGAAMAGGIGAAAEGVVKGIVEPALQQHLIDKANARIKRMEHVETKFPEQVLDVAAGKVDAGIPLDPEDREHLVFREAARRAGISKDASALSLENVLGGTAAKNEDIRALVDLEMLKRGTSVVREKNLRDTAEVLKTMRSTGDLPDDAHAALKQMERSLGTPDKDTGIYDGKPLKGSDPFIIASLSKNPKDFVEAVKSKYPSIGLALEKSSGRISLNEMYTYELANSLKYMFPDELKTTASDAITNQSAILYEVRKWIDTHPNDVEAIRKTGRQIHEIHGKLSSAGQDLQESVGAIHNALYSAPSGEAVGVEGVTRGSRLRNEERAALAKTASERLYREVSRAMESGSPINKEYLTSLRSDFGGVVTKDHMDALLEKVAKYNAVQSTLQPKMDTIKTFMVKRSYMGQKKSKIYAQSEAEIALSRVYSDTENIEARLHREFIKPILANPLDDVNPILEKLPTIAENMKNGTAIPNEVIAAIKGDMSDLVATRKAAGKSDTYRNRMGTFGEMLDNYNAQTHALDLAAESAATALMDSKQSMQSVLITSNLSEMINNPVMSDRLQVIQAYASAALSRELTGLDIPPKQLQTMIDALTGGATDQLRLYTSGMFSFQTYTHMLNTFESLKSNTVRMIDALDDLNRKNLGVPLDREVFLGYFLNPSCLQGRDGMFEKLQIDTNLLKTSIEEWTKIRERSANRVYGLKDAEMVETNIMYDTHLSFLKANNNYQTDIRRATTDLEETFLKDQKILRGNNLTKWAGEQFSQMFWKLNGSEGISKVGELFYGMTEEGKFVLTETGRIQRELFVNHTEEVNEAISDLRNIDDFVSLYHSVAGTPMNVPEVVAQSSAKAEAMFRYFQEPHFKPSQMSSAQWKEIWDAAEYTSRLRLKAWKRAREVVRINNERFKHDGVEVPYPEWRTFYVTVPKAASVFDVDAFSNTLFQDIDVSRYYKSSELGQLRKAEGIKLGFTNQIPDVKWLETPAASVYGYISKNLMDAHTAHARLVMEKHAALLGTLGFRQAAGHIQFVARERMRGAIHQSGVALFGATVRTKLAETPSLTAVSILWDPFKQVMLRGAVPVTRLSRPLSMGKNMLQATVRTALQDSNPVRGLKEGSSALRGTLYHLKNPAGGNAYQALTPEENTIISSVLGGYKDSSRRNIREKAGIMLSTRGPRHGTGTEFALGASDLVQNQIDWIANNFKERTEMATSRSNLELGALAYREVTEQVRNTSTHDAYEWLASRLPSKPKPLLWSLVTQVVEGVDTGDVNRALPAFLDIWHTSRIGRYGSLALPSYVSNLSAVLPSTFMYFPSRFQDKFRLADVLLESGFHASADAINTARANRRMHSEIEAQKILNHREGLDMMDAKAAVHPKWKGIPKQQRMAVWPTVMYGTGLLISLGALHDGADLLFPGTKEMRDKIRAEEDNTWWRKLSDGMGIDVTSLSPYAVRGWDSMAQGVVTTRDGFLDMGAVEVIKTLKSAVENFQQIFEHQVPMLNMETSINAAKAAMFKEVDPQGNKSPDYVAAQQKYHDEVMKYKDYFFAKFADYLLEALPISSIVPLAQNPFIVAQNSMYFDKGQYAAPGASTGYRGWISDLTEMGEVNPTGGIRYMFDSDKEDLANQWMTVWGMPEILARANAGLVQKLRNGAYEFDRYTGYMARNDPKSWDLTAEIRAKNEERRTLFLPQQRPELENRDLDFQNRMMERIMRNQSTSPIDKPK